jgi:hypothetical protein
MDQKHPKKFKKQSENINTANDTQAREKLSLAPGNKQLQSA